MADNVVKLAPVKTETVPEFITYRDIEAMSDDELDALVSAIRVRRMNSYLIYKQTKAEKESLEQDKARQRIEKKCEQIIKKINTIDAQLEGLEKFIAELRGLRLQAGMSVL